MATLRFRKPGANRLAWLAPALLWAGCAQVGPVLPPSAHLPQPITDFAAVRVGPALKLSWTAPGMTSDGEAWSGVINYSLCAWPGVVSGTPPPANVMAANPVGGAAPQIPSPAPSPATTPAGSSRTPAGRRMPLCPRLIRLPSAALNSATLPAATLSPGASGHLATLAVYAANADGQGAGWSNPVQVSLVPVAPPPVLETATTTADGVELTWRNPRPPGRVVVERGSKPLATLPPGTSAYLDRSIAWNQHYVYALRSVAGSGPTRVESAPSNSLQVLTRDVFPPPVPTGLQVVASASGADLSWDAVSAADLAGYNVYRRVGSGPWQRRNGAPLPTPVFHDAWARTELAAGVSATYAVTSIDRNGNESRRSVPVTVHP